MAGHGQFCAVARAHEAVGGRWTLLVVRELLSGARRFNDIRRGIPRLSRTMLAERLEALQALGCVARQADGYALTEAGLELAPVITALGHWGQRRLVREILAEDLDLEPVLIDMQRRVRAEALPPQPLVVRFDLASHPPRFLLLSAREVALCRRNPGFPEPLRLHGPLAALAAWWRGDASFAAAQRMGLALEGPRGLARAFPGWFARYAFAEVAPA
ncbi:winged helix-turn-helix transcriptional regulator [Falsiroseomonas selenitidurans]|uniref:Helix-turn-helix transcriptional regulator n=1 Tax=Falsiroseomonas selenitidurans TaxID=2716335 RepID=A0ABX1EAE0_9PROT|nr:helix-turn-helix domain-containing protein [Falsiroseomonas selenitidurans]NKC34190.1 helix-turn-helix transcriptional regulator [Falsiroseomonas selenitidurans]